MSILNQTSLTIIGGWNTQNCWRCWFLPWNHWQWDEFNNINNQHHTKAISVRIVDQPQAMFIAWLSIRTQLLSTVTTLADPTSVPWRSDGGDGLMRGDMLPGWLEILRIIEPYQHCESKQFLFSGYMKPYFFFVNRSSCVLSRGPWHKKMPWVSVWGASKRIFVQWCFQLLLSPPFRESIENRKHMNTCSYVVVVVFFILHKSKIKSASFPIYKLINTHPGWWFGTCFIFPYIGNVIIPTDFHIFQRGWHHQPGMLC